MVDEILMITMITYIHCDRCGEPHDNAPGENRTKREALDQARVHGFVRTLIDGRMKDFCPDCQLAITEDELHGAIPPY